MLFGRLLNDGCSEFGILFYWEFCKARKHSWELGNRPGKSICPFKFRRDY